MISKHMDDEMVVSHIVPFLCEQAEDMDLVQLACGIGCAGTLFTPMHVMLKNLSPMTLLQRNGACCLWIRLKRLYRPSFSTALGCPLKFDLIFSYSTKKSRPSRARAN